MSSRNSSISRPPGTAGAGTGTGTGTAGSKVRPRGTGAAGTVTEKSYILENKKSTTGSLPKGRKIEGVAGSGSAGGMSGTSTSITNLNNAMGTGTVPAPGNNRNTNSKSHSSSNSSSSASGGTSSQSQIQSSRPGGNANTNGASNGNPKKEAGESTTLSSPSSVSNNDDMSQLVQEMDMDDGAHKSSLSQASFNYINSIIGSGVIGMPYALRQSGVGVGLILLIVVACITDYSLVLMVKAGQLSGSYSYQGMMEAAFGKWGFYVLSILQFVYPIIAMISYNVIVGDTLTKVLIYFTAVRSESLEIQREVVVLIATFFITLPLSLYRNVARMAKISFMSLISIAFIMVSILIRLAFSPIPNVPVTLDAWSFSNTGVLQAIGVFAFAFMCHHNTFMIYTSMENSSERKWGKVTHISIGTSLAVSLVFSLVGYATFTGNVQGDLLENYCWDDDLMNISRVLFCVTILLTFPLECFVARDVIENICFYGKQPSTTTRHFCITFLIVLTAFVVSMSTDCLGLVLELNGILAAMPLAYILPALCYIRLEPSRFFSREKLPAIATALFGIIVSGTGLILLIVNGPEGNRCSHGEAMDYCKPPPSFIPSIAANNLSFSKSSSFISSPTLRALASSISSRNSNNMSASELLPSPVH